MGWNHLDLGMSFKKLAVSFILSFLSSFSCPLPFWGLLPFVISSKFPTREISIAAPCQLETSPCPISIASPGENLEAGPWSRWQGVALTNLRCVYWELGGGFLLQMIGYCLLIAYFDVEQILRQTRMDWWSADSIFPIDFPRSFPGEVHRQTSNVSNELPLFLPPSSSQIQWVSKICYSKFSYHQKVIL